MIDALMMYRRCLNTEHKPDCHHVMQLKHEKNTKNKKLYKYKSQNTQQNDIFARHL